MSFVIDGVGSIKQVTPEQWRGLIYNNKDEAHQVGLTNDVYKGSYQYSHSFDIQVLYESKWITPLAIITQPTFKTSRSANKPTSNSFNSFSSYGFANYPYGFSGSAREANNVSASWTAGQSYFNIDRHNNIDGSGILAWKFNSTALNLGSVVIFDTA